MRLIIKSLLKYHGNILITGNCSKEALCFLQQLQSFTTAGLHVSFMHPNVLLLYSALKILTYGKMS